MMKVSLILEAVNRATGPIRQVTASLERMGATSVATARRVAGSMMFMRDQVIDATHHFRHLAGEDGMLRASRSADYLKRQVSGLTGGLTLLKYAGGAAIVGLGEEFVRGVFKAGGETQQMLVTLNRLEGSATRAKQAMSWMQNFSMGAGAAFKMPDIMRSYQMAKNFGMDPQGGALASFADLAGAERVPLKQVLIAVKDAMEGTSTRPLANLGIKMLQGKGDGTNTYLYQDLISKKWITDQSKKTPEVTLAALLKIINRKYSGIALAQAQTVPGGFAQYKTLSTASSPRLRVRASWTGCWCKLTRYSPGRASSRETGRSTARRRRSAISSPALVTSSRTSCATRIGGWWVHGHRALLRSRAASDSVGREV